MSKISEALGDLNEDEVLAGVKQQIAEGTPALDTVEELQAGMAIVGSKYETCEYFLSELIMAAEIFKNANGLLGGQFDQAAGKTLGTMVLGTVKGDIHDFGKDIVAMVLRCNGINVVDLGVDVPYERFVEAVQEHNAELVGLSCLLTTAYESMKGTVAALEAGGLRDRVKILVGGGPVDQGVCDFAKADAYGRSAQEAVDVSKKLLGVK